MPWLLNLVYLVVLAAVAPVLLWQRLLRGKRRPGIWTKLTGQLARRDGDSRLAWFHAVSVGEVLQLEPMICECRSRWPSLEILVTTTTATGYRLACERFAEHRVDWFPLDFSWSVRRALRRVRPDLVVLVELELWPNFVLATHRAGIPLALVNGRISESSFRGYRRLKWLFAGLLPRFDRLIAQNETYAARLAELGGPTEKIHVSGSIKYDRIETRRDNPATGELAAELGIHRSEPVFVAGSTQEPEERLAVEAWQQARQTHPDLRLVLVPRHPERFDQVAEMVVSMGHPLLRRSQNDGAVPRTQERPVVLLDTIGELAACWGLADVAFVGGSLGNRGGQNMIEPAAYGAAVLFGPNTQNFQDVVDELLERGGARVVGDGAALTQRLQELLDDPSTANALGEAARGLVLARQGATESTLDILQELLPSETLDSTTRHGDPAAADAA
jgi:3-deoxy-D-manno-octulosonic-acid transferase